MIQPQARHRQKLFFLASLSLLCFLPLFPHMQGITPLLAPAALLTGTAYALTLGNPFHQTTKHLGKWLLQGSVVLLGFSMDIGKVAKEGGHGLAFSLVSISLVFALGWYVGRALKLNLKTTLLVSAGTAICGGSAIAAVSSVIDAPEEDVSIAVGTVFLLNAIALFLFPPLGHLIGLSPDRFGVWAGIAIHDIASVVGAGSAYGTQALDIATTVKLSRVLFLVPITLMFAYRFRGAKKRSQHPWFVGLFLLASITKSFVAPVAAQAPSIKLLATCGFALSLLLVGMGLTRTSLRAVGVRPLILGCVLWVFISVVSLVAVTAR